jgi:hypothetical protein
MLVATLMLSVDIVASFPLRPLRRFFRRAPFFFCFLFLLSAPSPSHPLSLSLSLTHSFLLSFSLVTVRGSCAAHWFSFLFLLLPPPALFIFAPLSLRSFFGFPTEKPAHHSCVCVS